MYKIFGYNVPAAYEEFQWTFKGVAVTEDSRNGPVWTVPMPTAIEIERPDQRVLFDPIRDANPFFHAMEFVWMMSGNPRVRWIAKFNKQMAEYSDDGRTLPNSYGVRWRKHFWTDQIETIIIQLKADHKSRRAVISMWDADVDSATDSALGKDVPCNTTIFFRIQNERLNMLVCNRSNDAIWGAFGTNCVHMTLLQELIARAIGVELGRYSVVTMNLHVYQNLPRVNEMLDSRGGSQNHYRMKGLQTFPILNGKESYYDFIRDCEDMVTGKEDGFITAWMSEVAKPIRDAYEYKGDRNQLVTNIMAQDWRVACSEWVARRTNANSHL